MSSRTSWSLVRLEVLTPVSKPLSGHSDSSVRSPTKGTIPPMSDSSKAKPAVIAAGALCWREGSQGLELLIIHRPKYDDWSWPKGKLDDGESIPETAVREVREEVGLKITLGVPLTTTSYRVSSGLKNVYYWASEIPQSKKPQVDDKEVDRLEWVSPEKARSLLTNSSDRYPLDRLVELYEADDLRTRQLMIVRHAKAKPRSSWSRAEGDRPLAATGKRQAHAVWRLLDAWKPSRIISSPWMRCMQTVAGYAKANGLPIKEKNRLTEAEHKRKPAKAAKLMESLFDSNHSTVVCTHRPVLPTILKVVGHHLPKELKAKLPAEDPYLAPGQMLVLDLSIKHRDRVISVEKIEPFDD